MIRSYLNVKRINDILSINLPKLLEETTKHTNDLTTKYKNFLENNKNKRVLKKEKNYVEPEPEPPKLSGWRKLMKKTTGY